jgi:hypothetical protein
MGRDLARARRRTTLACLLAFTCTSCGGGSSPSGPTTPPVQGAAPGRLHLDAIVDFGTDTCGVPTANRGFALSDGATLILTVSINADRLFNSYNAPIPPDESVPDAAIVLQRAIDWLRSGR